jgi:hypothetical protein
MFDAGIESGKFEQIVQCLLAEIRAQFVERARNVNDISEIAVRVERRTAQLHLDLVVMRVL